MKFLKPSIKIISIVGILICAAVVVGVWIINGALTQGLTRTLTGIESVINIAEKSTQTVEQATTGLQVKIDAIKQEINEAGNEETGITVTPAVLDKVGALNLAMRLETADELVDQIHKTIESINQLVEAANALPLFSIPSLPADHLDTVRGRLSEMMVAARGIESISLELQANGKGKTVSTLIAHFDSLHNLAQDIRASVEAFNTSTVVVKKAAARIIDKLAAWIFMGSIFLSLIFVWFIYAQVCVFVHARN